MAIIEWKKDGTVAIMTMNNGENRHNPDFNRAILNAFDEIENDETVSSVVITSSDQKNWSQGIDVEWIMGAMNNKETPVDQGFHVWSEPDIYKNPVFPDACYRVHKRACLWRRDHHGLCL